jgi:hypothetical protein
MNSVPPPTGKFMSRTPIIVPGQVYLHPVFNEYFVVTKATRGDIQFRGPGFRGMHEVELFLQRFQPVDSNDLNGAEIQALAEFTTAPLSTGWVARDDDEFDEE